MYGEQMRKTRKTHTFRNYSWVLACVISLICILGLITIKWYKDHKKIKLYWDTPFYISAKTVELLNEEIQKCGYNVEIEFKYIDFENYYSEVSDDIENENVDILFSGLISCQKIGKRNMFIENIQPWDVFFKVSKAGSYTRHFLISFGKL